MNVFNGLLYLITIFLILLRRYLNIEEPAYRLVNGLSRQVYLLSIYLIWLRRHLEIKNLLIV